MTAALLLAEPEPSVRGFLERQLRNDGFDVVSCERAEQLPRAADPDLLVLGDADALDRGVVPDCPVIVLGSADPAARVRTLARADDCLARPFVYEELLARIHALLRRCPPRVELLEIGPLAVDRAARRVTVDAEEVELSGKEFALLVKLAWIPTASSRASSCSATSGGSAPTCRRGPSSHMPPASAASSPPPGYPAGS